MGLQLPEQQSEFTEQEAFLLPQVPPPEQPLVSYWQLEQASVPPLKPRLTQVSANGTPASHCSLPSTTPSPQTAGGAAQTRSAGLPPVQLPTPEQQFVDAVQGAPLPVATHCPTVVVVVVVVVVLIVVVVVVVVVVGTALNCQRAQPIRS